MSSSAAPTDDAGDAEVIGVEIGGLHSAVPARSRSSFPAGEVEGRGRFRSVFSVRGRSSFPAGEVEGRGRLRSVVPVRGRSAVPADERGISTLEWILLVAAVGGIATLGVLLVRGANNEASESADGERAARELFEIARADGAEDGARSRLACSTEPGGRLRQWSGIFTFRYTPATGLDPATCIPVCTNNLGTPN